MVHKSRESKWIFHGSRKNRKPVSRGQKNIDSQIMGKKILIHASHKEKMPIHASRKNYRGPSGKGKFKCLNEL